MKITNEVSKLLEGKKVKSGKISFDVDSIDTDARTPRANGILKIGNNKHKGFFEYSEKSGLGWSFKPSLDVDALEDQHADDWEDFKIEMIDFIQNS